MALVGVPITPECKARNLTMVKRKPENKMEISKL